MRLVRLGAALLLLLVLTGRTNADTDLESALDAAYFPRLHDAALHDLAHQRAEFQVAYSGGACDGDGSLTHDGIMFLEVLLCDWDGEVVGQWMASPGHHAILSDQNLNSIGCGSAPGLNGAMYYACLLSGAPPAPVVVAPPPQTTPIPAPGPAGQPSNVGGSESTSLPAATPAGEPIAVARTPTPQPLQGGGESDHSAPKPPLVLLPNTALETP